ncbi:hypothetical protein CEXT_631911 [Caerostris extrusa]|uniref:Uncharacterized protein n=1 Tax=Caerostris extrusa TaxID=172846 RepID=A0AAV4T9J1_CAEEX|nr:hypothetical protein CEXT_631911 [Caerostris extrusa]
MEVCAASGTYYGLVSPLHFYTPPPFLMFAVAKIPQNTVDEKTLSPVKRRNNQKFNVTDTDECLCGSTGSSDHYTFSCPLTENNHLQKSVENIYGSWAKATAKSFQAKRKF